MRRRDVGVAGMAGWLFADVLLALLIVFLGSEVRHRHVVAQPQVTPNPVKSRVKAGVLDPRWVDVIVSGLNQTAINSHSKGELNVLAAKLRRNRTWAALDRNSRFAPVVEVFSSARNTSIDAAVATSKIVSRYLKSRGGIIDTETVAATYFDGSLDPGQIRIRLFLVAK